MTDLPELDRVEGVCTEIDWRLIPVYDQALLGTTEDADDFWVSLSEQQMAAFYACMRAAYGRGYCDALCEDTAGNRGELLRQFGFKQL